MIVHDHTPTTKAIKMSLMWGQTAHMPYTKHPWDALCQPPGYALLLFRGVHPPKSPRGTTYKPFCSWPFSSPFSPSSSLLQVVWTRLGRAATSRTAMSDGSGFPGFHSHSYDRSYSRPLFQVASFSDSGDEQENHVSSPQMCSHSTSRTMPAKPVAPSCLSPSVSRLSMKKTQQVIIVEKSMEEEGNGCQPV